MYPLIHWTRFMPLLKMIHCAWQSWHVAKNNSSERVLPGVFAEWNEYPPLEIGWLEGNYSREKREICSSLQWKLRCHTSSWSLHRHSLTTIPIFWSRDRTCLRDPSAGLSTRIRVLPPSATNRAFRAGEWTIPCGLHCIPSTCPFTSHTTSSLSQDTALISKSTDTRVTWAWWLKCHFFVTVSCEGFNFGGDSITVLLFIEYDPFWQLGCWIFSKKGKKITPTVMYITWDPLPWQVFCLNTLSDHVESPPTACTM